MVRISVIIPTRNRAEDLGRCLDGLAACARRLETSGHPARLHEVIVVDDASTVPGSTDPARASGLPVRVMENQQQQGAGASRRLAAATVTGEVIAFLDDDAVPRGDWLARAAELDQDHPAVTGRVLRFDDGLISSARQARYDARYEKLRRDAAVGFFAGGNSAVLTEVFHAVGGFSREGSGGDNSLADSLAERGTPVRFRPELVIAHRNGKGWQRAVTDAWSAGLQHPQAMTAVQCLKAVRDSGIGRTWQVREVNRLLGAVHAVGRVAPLTRTPAAAGTVSTPRTAGEPK